MNILVAGGTGFIGSHIVQKLRNIGDSQVFILSRKKNPQDPFLRTGNVTIPETLKGVFDHIDVVIQCIQFPNHPVQDYKKGYTYEKYDAEGTENLSREILKSSVKRIIYLSGAGTSRDRVEPWFKAKVRAEEAIKATGREYVILRPSWVYGPGDHSLNRLIDFAKILPVMPVIGDGRSRVSPVYVEDLADIVVKAITLPPSAHLTIDVGGPESLTMNEVQRAILNHLGKKKPLLHHPLWFMKGVGRMMTAVMNKPLLSSEAVDFMTMDLPIRSDQAEKTFGQRMVSLREALPLYIKKRPPEEAALKT